MQLCFWDAARRKMIAPVFDDQNLGRTPVAMLFRKDHLLVPVTLALRIMP